MQLGELTARVPDLASALGAACDAASLLERSRQEGRELKVDLKGLHDYVTQIDRESEELIGRRLELESAHALLGEEGGGNVASEARFWVVDPLDGTSNYIHGYPAYAVSIGLLERVGAQVETRRFPQVSGCASILGVVADVCHGQVFLAAKGQGAWRLRLSNWELSSLADAGNLELEALHVGSAKELGNAFLATGFPVRYRDLAHQYLSLFELIMPQSAGLRRGGSAALDLAYTAAGVFDGFFELFLAPWDLAAGLCLIEEAGGSIRGLAGDPVSDGHLLAGNPDLIADLEKRIQGCIAS